MDPVFRALADPARRALLDELAARDEQTLFELCVRLMSARGITMSRQGVAKHLAVLRDAGLVEQRVSGRTTIHTLSRAGLAEARAWLDRISDGRHAP